MSARDDIYILRIAGVVDDDGEQIAYTTRTLAYTSPPTQSAAIADVQGTMQQACRILEPVGSAGGLSLELTYGAPYVDRITRQQIAPVRSSGGVVVRVVRPALTGSLLYTQVQPDLTSGDLVYIGGELVEYTSWTALPSYSGGAGYMTVVRGQGGTPAQPIPVVGAGTVVLSQLPSVVGQRCTLSRVPATATSSADEEVVYRGTVDGLTPDGPKVALAIGSAMSRLRDRQYIPAASADLDEGVEIRFAVTDAGVTPAIGGYGVAQIRIDALPEDVTGTPLLWLSLSRDGVSATLLVTGAWYQQTIGGVRTTRVGVSSSSSALLMRIGTRTLSASEAAAELTASWRVTSVQVADQIGLGTQSLGDVVNTVLGGEAGPVGRRGLLTQAERADIVPRLNAACGVSSVTTTMYDGSQRLVLPQMDSPRALRSVLADMLAPWGCSLASTGDGKITAIDWLEPRTSYGSLSYEGEARSEWSSIQIGSDGAIRAVTIDAVSDAGHRIRRTLVADTSMQVSQGGEHLTLDAELWGPLWPQLQARWYGLLSLYQTGSPRVSLDVAQDNALDVGDWCLVDSPTMHSADGTRGITGVAAVVTGRARRLDGPVVTLELALVGWGITSNARRWGPSLRVASVSSGATDVVTAADYFDADEAAGFAAGDHVILYDDVGNLVDGTPREVLAVGTGTITCELFSTTPVADDIIVLADYDETAHRSWAWMADAAGTLGAASDAGHTWR